MRRYLRIIKRAARTKKPISASPPRRPPTIAPTLLFEPELDVSVFEDETITADCEGVEGIELDCDDTGVLDVDDDGANIDEVDKALDVDDVDEVGEDSRQDRKSVV